MTGPVPGAGATHGTPSSGQRTLLVVLSHPDDELVCAGTILAQRAAGDRVVLALLTRGEASGAFGPVPRAEVARRREEQAARVAEMLGVELVLEDFEDCAIEASPASSRRVARLITHHRPDGILTWGDAWVKGMRHPDHQATGAIARNAVTLARIASVVEPDEPHRAHCPVFTIRGLHSQLPAVSVDIGEYLEGILEVADFYHRAVGFGDRDWLLERLRIQGAEAGCEFAESFDAWETRPGRVASLLPAEPAGQVGHPPRPDRLG